MLSVAEPNQKTAHIRGSAVILEGGQSTLERCVVSGVEIRVAFPLLLKSRNDLFDASAIQALEGDSFAVAIAKPRDTDCDIKWSPRISGK
jgi:hypothetical protein